mgnify:CR=1 FL=1
MDERLAEILQKTVQEFIRTGEPISSSCLYERYDFGIRPARIRSKLQELTDLGFLEQPYHSAGRVPSDKGYEFLVEGILADDSRTLSGAETFQKFFKKYA